MKLYQHFFPGENRTGEMRADSQPARSVLLRTGMQHHKFAREPLPLGPIVDNPGAPGLPRPGIQGADFHRGRIGNPGQPLLPAWQPWIFLRSNGPRSGLGGYGVRPEPPRPDQGRVPPQPLHHGTGSGRSQPNRRTRCQGCKCRPPVSRRRGTHPLKLRRGRPGVHRREQNHPGLCNRIVTGPDTLSVPNHPASAVRLWDYICVPEHTARFWPTGRSGPHRPEEIEQ